MQPLGVPGLIQLGRVYGIWPRSDQAHVPMQDIEQLRQFIEAQYGLRATHQTTAEFLISMSESRDFSAKDSDLLAHFLERCDLLKFAHIEASSTDNQVLHERGLAFVQGARA